MANAAANMSCIAINTHVTPCLSHSRMYSPACSLANQEETRAVELMWVLPSCLREGHHVGQLPVLLMLSTIRLLAVPLCFPSLSHAVQGTAAGVKEERADA